MAKDDTHQDGERSRRAGGEAQAAPAAGGGKVAMVTGGSRGIGRAGVEALLGAGYRVYFASRTQDSVTRALAELRARHGDAAAGRPRDVRRQGQGDAFVRWVINEAGRLASVVNN